MTFQLICEVVKHFNFLLTYSLQTINIVGTIEGEVGGGGGGVEVFQKKWGVQIFLIKMEGLIK